MNYGRLYKPLLGIGYNITKPKIWKSLRDFEGPSMNVLITPLQIPTNSEGSQPRQRATLRRNARSRSLLHTQWVSGHSFAPVAPLTAVVVSSVPIPVPTARLLNYLIKIFEFVLLSFFATRFQFFPPFFTHSRGWWHWLVPAYRVVTGHVPKGERFFAIIERLDCSIQ